MCLKLHISLFPLQNNAYCLRHVLSNLPSVLSFIRYKHFLVQGSKILLALTKVKFAFELVIPCKKFNFNMHALGNYESLIHMHAAMRI